MTAQLARLGNLVLRAYVASGLVAKGAQIELPARQVASTLVMNW